MLGNNFSRRNFEILFLFFPENRQFASNAKACFVGKIRKISSVCHLLHLLTEWLQVNPCHAE